MKSQRKTSKPKRFGTAHARGKARVTPSKLEPQRPAKVAAPFSATAKDPSAKASPRPAAPIPRARRAQAAPAPVLSPPLRARKPVVIPPALLDPDTLPIPEVSGPGERYSLGPRRLAATGEARALWQELPESYGTERLFLTARDPHWLYAAWDLTPEQRQRYNSLAKDGHLALRTYIKSIHGTPAVEVAVHPESRSWFIPVDRGSTQYLAELGYYDHQGNWQRVTTSPATLTPPESASPDLAIEFATIPPEVSLNTLVKAVQEAVSTNAQLLETFQELQAKPASPAAPAPAVVPEPPPNLPAARRSAPPLEPEPRTTSPSAAPEVRPPQRVHQPTRNGHADQLLPPPPAPLIESVRRLRSNGRADLPQTVPASAPTWTAEQARALKEIVRVDQSRRVWMGSLEITELIRRHLEEGISSAAAAPGVEVSSPAGGKQGHRAGQKSFWLKVNAELIIYGATEPNAKVTIEGRPIRLRADGSFGYRFALPDGQYPLQIAATSGDGADVRATRLEFSRNTRHQGEVGAHEQDPHLTTPGKVPAS
jgi:hypothetical protein